MDDQQNTEPLITEAEMLADRFEMYQLMATVFYRRLAKEEKVDALLEVIELLKGTTDG